MRYFATYLYIIKYNSLDGQSCLFRVTGQMAWFVVLSLFVVSMTLSAYIGDAYIYDACILARNGSFSLYR